MTSFEDSAVYPSRKGRERTTRFNAVMLGLTNSANLGLANAVTLGLVPRVHHKTASRTRHLNCRRLNAFQDQPTAADPRDKPEADGGVAIHQVPA
jgi:hypothetical protein